MRCTYKVRFTWRMEQVQRTLEVRRTEIWRMEQVQRTLEVRRTRNIQHTNIGYNNPDGK